MQTERSPALSSEHLGTSTFMYHGHTVSETCRVKRPGTESWL